LKYSGSYTRIVTKPEICYDICNANLYLPAQRVSPMTELELSIMAESESGGDSLRLLLNEFEARHGIHVRLRVLSYETAWRQLVKFALYGQGPDVSQVGSTWIGNLVGMNALRPFTDQELAHGDMPSIFSPAIWQSRPGLAVWAVPWMADVRLIYYRRDWLSQAGVDAATAFDSPHSLDRTLARLRAHGVALPWAMPTERTLLTVHSVASWVWHAGGDFVRADGKGVLFTTAETLSGLRAYFDLYPYLLSAPRPLGDPQASDLLLAGQAAVTLSGPWTWLGGVLSQDPESSPVTPTSVGLALPLGIPFSGSEYLVVWNSTRHPAAALQLIYFLTGRPVQAAYPRTAGLLPVRLDVLSEPPFTNDPACQMMARALRKGRSFPLFAHWGLIEDHLVDALGQIWADILGQPNPDVEAAIRGRLELLAQRLNLNLAAG
jgi:multiple sugar transport system substrate-binding protein